MTRRALAVLFAAILGMHLCLEVQAGGTPIRVGYFAFPGYHERAEDGHMSGYGYELLQKIASYT